MCQSQIWKETDGAATAEADALSLIPQERWQRINKQITEDSVEKVKLLLQEQFAERICEKIVNVPVSQVSRMSGSELKND